VVARIVQFLSDNRDDQHLIEDSGLPEDRPEEDEAELADASEV
jgi:hypothetical protein